jgi:uncharacterized protein
MSTATPGRLANVDILRGAALLGMIVVHFHDHSTEPGGFDDTIRTFIWRFIESKSHGTFALLFGAGFAIQLRRAELRGAPFAALYLRRLAVLAAFGFAAHAFFGFNVLLGYAVWGVPLLFVRNWSTRSLVLLALLSILSVSLFNRGYQRYLTATGGPEAVAAVFQARQAEAISVNGALEAAEAQSSYPVLLSARLRHMAWFHQQAFFFLPGATLGLFIVGLLMIRHRVFEDVLAHRRFLIGFAVFGVIAWAFANWGLDMIGIQTTLGLLRDQWLTFTYVSCALLLMAARPALVPRLRFLSNPGRMALTNYLVQIAAVDLLFSGYAVGLIKIRPLYGLCLALTLFTLQSAFSTFWLRKFRFGPAEWVWRSLTHMKRQKMLKTAVTDGEVQALR